MTAQGENRRAFYWVNKDLNSNNFSHSEGDEAKSILKFVQRSRPRECRRTRRHVRRQTYDYLAFETGARSRLYNHSQGSFATPMAPQSTDCSIQKFESMQSRWRVSRPVNNNLTQGSALDPFATTIVPMSPSILSLIQYSERSILIGSGGYKTEAFSDSLRPFTDMYRAGVEYSMQNILRYPHVLYPMLAAFSQRLWCNPTDFYPLPEPPGWYLQLGIQSVRKAIEEQSNDNETMRHVASGIHFLIRATGVAGRVAESQLHTRAFLKLLPRVNTKTLEFYWVLDTVTSIDIINSTAIDQAPLMNIAISDPGIMSPVRAAEMLHVLQLLRQDARLAVAEGPQMATGCSEPIIEKILMKFDLLQFPALDLDLELGVALEAALEGKQIHRQIVPTLQKVVDCLNVAKVIWRSPDQVTKSDSIWLCRRTKAVLHELLNMTDARKIDQSTLLGCQAECLRLTLVIMLEGALHRLLHLSRHRLAARLKNALEPIVDLDWVCSLPMADVGVGHNVSVFDANEMLLWMLMMGHWLTARDGQMDWFAERAVGVARTRLSLCSASDVHQTLNKYLYSKTLQRKAVIEFSKMLQS